MQAADCSILWCCDLPVDCVRVICGVVLGGGVKQAFCHKQMSCGIFRCTCAKSWLLVRPTVVLVSHTLYFQGRSNVPPEKIPWNALCTLLSQCIYGGRIDNDFDQVASHRPTVVLKGS